MNSRESGIQSHAADAESKRNRAAPAGINELQRAIVDHLHELDVLTKRCSRSGCVFPATGTPVLTWRFENSRNLETSGKPLCAAGIVGVSHRTEALKLEVGTAACAARLGTGFPERRLELSEAVERLELLEQLEGLFA